LQALIHYQLRALWEAAQERVATLIRELSAQREDYERRQFIVNLNRDRFDVQRSAQQQLADAERSSAEVRAKLAALMLRRDAAQSWWHYFTRQQLERRRAALESEQQLVQIDLDAAREAMAEFQNSQMPEFPGLSVESRRAINLAAIAFAALIHSRLSVGGLADQATDAMACGEPADLGKLDGAAILAMMGEIARGRQLVHTSAGAIADVKEITERLRGMARYRSAEETTPMAESLDPPSAAAAQGGAAIAARAVAPVNVLRSDLFGISELLL
jgi:hypothetical protein